MSDYANGDIGSHGKNCRTCTDFKTWAKLQRERMKTLGDRGNIKQAKEIKNEPSQALPSDCPLDKDALGNATWGLLHTIGATYPDNPTNEQKNDVTNFMNILSRIYPCSVCAHDLIGELKEMPIDASSQNAFSQWLCRLHNKVNKKLGKPLFDCSKVNERWRDGWSDGRCD